MGNFDLESYKSGMKETMLLYHKRMRECIPQEYRKIFHKKLSEDAEAMEKVNEVNEIINTNV